MDDIYKYVKFRSPFTCCVVGSSGSGKTILVRNFLKNFKNAIQLNELTSKLKVLWVYGAEQNIFKIPIANDVEIRYTTEIPTHAQLKASPPHVIVIDDLFNELGNSSQLASLFTKQSHHLNISIIFITQNIFPKGSQMRNVTLNTHYFILMKNTRDKSQIMRLAGQISPENRKMFLSFYNKSTKRKFGYLVIDLKTDTPDKVRYRSRITTEELPSNLKMFKYIPIIYKYSPK